VAAVPDEVGSLATFSAVRSSSDSGWGSAFASLLERVEIWVRDPFLCMT